MMSADSGINKPFDRILKSFADEAPRLLLRLLGVVDLDDGAEIEPLRPETAPPVVFPDFVVMLSRNRRPKSIVHCEFLAYYIARAVPGMARYGGSLAQQYGVDVLSALILLRPDGAPDTFPEIAEYRIGATRVLHPFMVVRLWELDPAPVVATNDRRLFPWAVLMKSTDAQVREIGEMLSRDGDEESRARFLTLGSVRYDREDLEGMIGGTGMGLTEAILEGSSLVRHVTEKAVKAASEASRADGLATGLAEGLEKGREKGREEGKLDEARRLLRSALAAKFPGLESIPEIDAIPNVEAVERVLIEGVLKQPDRQSAEDAIRAAARGL